MADFKRRKNAESGKRQAVETENYNYQTLHEDRRYGMYWYAWLWKILRPVLIFFCAALIVVGIVDYGYHKIYDDYLGAVNPQDGSTVRFEIESGASVTRIGSDLEKANLIHSGTLFKYMVQFQGLTNKLSYGTFELSPSMPLTSIVTALTNGSQTNERTITIVPGWTCEDIAEYLVREGAISDTDAFLRLCNEVDRFVADSYSLRFAQDANTLSGRKYALEGYLAPDTYRVFTSATPETIIATLLLQNNTVTDTIFNDDEKGMRSAEERDQAKLSRDQYIILASMIEKEAARTEDYAKVSAVFHNRLKAGWRLESDPTATYLSGLTHYVLTQEEYNDANLYNTYVIAALPVGPICNPSVKALEAALNPDIDYIRQSYMYFCPTDPASGELAFAITREEHLENVAKYQQMWIDFDAAHAAG